MLPVDRSPMRVFESPVDKIFGTPERTHGSPKKTLVSPEKQIGSPGKLDRSFDSIIAVMDFTVDEFAEQFEKDVEVVIPPNTEVRITGLGRKLTGDYLFSKDSDKRDMAFMMVLNYILMPIGKCICDIENGLADDYIDAENENEDYFLLATSDNPVTITVTPMLIDIKISHLFERMQIANILSFDVAPKQILKLNMSNKKKEWLLKDSANLTPLFFSKLPREYKNVEIIGKPLFDPRTIELPNAIVLFSKTGFNLNLIKA